MKRWHDEWGSGPRRVVRPYWTSPDLIVRQALSALCLGGLTGWRGLPRWLLRYGFRCLPGAAGSRGMGCIGFPAHPVWEMTTACNLHCIHCHASGGKPSDDELATSEAKRLLDQLATIREFRMMAYTGGEPLLREDLLELLAYVLSGYGEVLWWLEVREGSLAFHVQRGWPEVSRRSSAGILLLRLGKVDPAEDRRECGFDLWLRPVRAQQPLERPGPPQLIRLRPVRGRYSGDLLHQV